MTSAPDAARAAQAVNLDDIVDLAKELIRIPSFKGEESDCARFLVDYLKGRGFEADLQEVEPGRYQAIGRLRGRGGGKSLMLNGHLDIDPLARDWKRDPWTPTLEGDRLYGAGVANMKAGVAAIVGAADAIRRSGVQLAGDIVIAGVDGELQGGVGTKFITEHGPRTDMAIVAEPYGADNIVTVHTGWVQFAVHVLGSSRHISWMEEGVDAIEKASKAAAALRGIKFTYEPRADLPGLPRLLVGNIVGGQGREYDMKGPNYVCDFVTMIVDVRFNHSQTPESVEADVRRTLDAVKAEDPQFDYELEFPAPPRFKVSYVIMPPFENPAGSEIQQAVARAYRSVVGQEPKTNGGPILPTSYAGDDTCHLQKAGISSLLYGPAGFYDFPEHPDMYSTLPEMERAARVIAATAVDVCSRPA